MVVEEVDADERAEGAVVFDERVCDGTYHSRYTLSELGGQGVF